jgi:hypothetical protein
MQDLSWWRGWCDDDVAVFFEQTQCPTRKCFKPGSAASTAAPQLCMNITLGVLWAVMCAFLNNNRRREHNKGAETVVRERELTFSVTSVISD